MNNEYVYFVLVDVAHIVLLKYFKYFNKDLIEICPPVMSYYITESEATLWDDININHSDRQYKRSKFMENKDLIVRLDDFKILFSFFKNCYHKINLYNPQDTYTFGFIKPTINDYALPYCVKNGIKLVPVIFLEGSLEMLNNEIVNIDNWELAYLKFCCKLMGIKNKYYIENTWQAISIDTLKQYYSPEESIFKELWPKSWKIPQLFNNDTNKPICWIIHPSSSLDYEIIEWYV